MNELRKILRYLPFVLLTVLILALALLPAIAAITFVLIIVSHISD